MPRPIIRAESHMLSSTPAQRADVERTIAAYRRCVRALSGVILVHWPELAQAPIKCQAVEALFHATAKRPVVRYAVLDRMLGKMPSYLRRAAIMAAYGAVSSFLSNYDNWLGGEIGGVKREIGARPPRLGVNKAFPPLYGGNMVLIEPGRRTVQIKLLSAAGQWRFSEPLQLKGRFKRLSPDISIHDLCPTLMIRGAKLWLACPVKFRPPRYLTNQAVVLGAAQAIKKRLDKKLNENKELNKDIKKDSKNKFERSAQQTPYLHRVCSVDVGINTAATAAIVDSSGTVIARTFLTCGRHNDRRDALAAMIAEKRSLSGGLQKGERSCVALHRRIAGYSLDAARQLASQIEAFAVQHRASFLVIEDLKGWRPKGPSKAMRKRFHRFEHRALVNALSLKAQELGMRVLEVNPRGTSRWAYDGSGVVKRDKANAQLATFVSGKKYNADLNGALNIAARGLAMLLGITLEPAPKGASDARAATGKSSGAVERMPLVLADIWVHAQTLRGACHRPAPTPEGI